MEDWKNIVQVAAGFDHTVGLKKDGTVVAIGYTDNRRKLDIGHWANIVDVELGVSDVFGVKSDGTVVVSGKDKDEDEIYKHRLNIAGWKDIVQVQTGFIHTISLKKDGIVVATKTTEHRKFGQVNVSKWKDIQQIAAGTYFSERLKKDGAIVVTGLNEDGQINVKGWPKLRATKYAVLELSPYRLVTVIVNGVEQDFAQPAIIKNYNTLVPLRGIFEKLGATVKWDKVTQTVTASKENTEIQLTIGNTNAIVNGN